MLKKIIWYNKIYSIEYFDSIVILHGGNGLAKNLENNKN